MKDSDPVVFTAFKPPANRFNPYRDRSKWWRSSRSVRFLTALIFFASVSGLQADEATFDPAMNVKIITYVIEESHLSKPVVNDEISRRWLDAFIDSIDPRRLYFLQSDLEVLSQNRDNLDDLAKNGDYQFATSVLELYRLRLKQSSAITREFLDQDHDFTVDENCQGRFTNFADSKESLRERLRLTLKLELLSERVHGREIASTKSLIEKRLQRLSNRAENMSDELWCDIYLNALGSSVDPHTGHWRPSVLRSYTGSSISLNPTYTFRVRLFPGDGYFRLASLPHGLGKTDSLARVVGWNLVGFRQLDGTYHDLVEDPEIHQYLRGRGPLGQDSQVDLELRHPNTWERITLRVSRYRSR